MAKHLALRARVTSIRAARLLCRQVPHLPKWERLGFFPLAVNAALPYLPPVLAALGVAMALLEPVFFQIKTDRDLDMPGSV